MINKQSQIIYYGGELFGQVSVNLPSHREGAATFKGNKMNKHKYNLFPEISGNDFNSLKESLKKGYDKTFPVIVYENAILDGWNRYRACKELGIEPVIKNYEGDNQSALDFVLLSNERRHLEASQRAMIGLQYLPLYEAEAEKIRKEKISEYRKTGETVAQKPPSKSREQVADKMNVSARYIQEAKKIEKEHPEYVEPIIKGKKTITEVNKEIKRQEVLEKIANIKEKETLPPTGKYDVIIIDPPWEMKKIERDVAPNQVEFDYPTMTLEEIKAFELPAEKDCHVFMWTTHKHLPYSFDIFNSWYVKYVCCFVWHKNGGFQPFGLPQYNNEFVLYGRIGTPQFIDFKQFFTCFNANRTGHSKKPDEFYETIKRVTAGKRIDIFNRRKIDGFDVWGNEA